MDNIQTGLMVSIVGITITFIALFIFIGVIVVLQKLFPPKPEQEESKSEEKVDSNLSLTSDDQGSEETIVAAIAAAAYIRARHSDQLGTALLSGPGPYRTSRQLPKL